MAANLPEDILKLIRRSTKSLKDYIRFRAICKEWKSVVFPKDNYSPWLMLIVEEDETKYCALFGCYNGIQAKLFETKFSEIQGRKCWASPNSSWLVTFGIDLDIHLFNPLSRTRVSLPSQRTFTHQYPPYMSDPRFVFETSPFVHKFLVSNSSLDGQPDSFFVMAIYSEYSKIAIAKPGDSIWSPILTPDHALGIRDIAFFKQNLFALDLNGAVFLCDLSSIENDLVATEFITTSPFNTFLYEAYLVVMGDDDLCLVIRNLNGEDENDDTTKSAFDIYKLDMNRRSWSKVYSLEGWCLFWVTNCSFFVKEFGSWKQNCIYCINDYCYYKTYEYKVIDDETTGIFVCENDKMKRLVESVDMKSVFSPPLWITPCLQ